MSDERSNDLLPPTLRLISDYVDYYARQSPNNEAMVTGDSRCTYAELERQVNLCARALMAAGIQKGDRVGTLCVPHNDFLVIFLATGSIGAIWIGLNPRHQLDELKFVVADAAPAILFSRAQIGGRDYRKDLDSLRKEINPELQIVLLDDSQKPCPYATFGDFLGTATEIDDPIFSARRGSVESSDAALIVYTSGSTGRPKGVVISHYALIKCSRTQLRYWHAAPIRMLNFLPINHIGCVGDISCYCLLAGGTTVFMEKFDAAASLELTEKEKITIWVGVPTTLQMCVSHPEFYGYDYSSVQMIFWSGAAASSDLVERLKSVSKNLSTSYGMTETVGSVTFSDVCSDVDVLANTIGKPAKGYEVRIVDKTATSGKSNAAGELLVRGDFIMTEYWRQPEATADAIDEDGWLHTGDLAEKRADGNLRLIGRLKEMFKSGGYNIYPREIETALESHPLVAVAAVVSVPDELFQEVGVAFLETTPGQSVSSMELDEYCRQKMANYKVPKMFVVQDSLPRLPVGKIDKKTLQQSALELRS